MTDLREPGLRERKRVATRRAIERAALELSLDKGFENVTIDEIAEAAEVSPRTFFNYFPSKEAAIVGHHPEGPGDEQIEAFLNGGPEQSILDGIRLMLDPLLDTKGEHDALAAGELQKLRMQLMLQSPVLFRQRMETMEELTQRMIDLVSKRLLRDYPSLAEDETMLRERARLVVFVSFAGLRSAWASWADRGGEGPLTECVKRSFDQLHELSSRVNV